MWVTLDGFTLVTMTISQTGRPISIVYAWLSLYIPRRVVKQNVWAGIDIQYKDISSKMISLKMKNLK